MGKNSTYRPAIVNLTGSGEKVCRNKNENVTELETKLPSEPSTQSVDELTRGVVISRK